MTQQKLLEEALKRIDSLSDEEFSSLTAEIIAESSVTKGKTQPEPYSMVIESNYHRMLPTSSYTCLEEDVGANDINLAEAA